MRRFFNTYPSRVQKEISIGNVVITITKGQHGILLIDKSVVTNDVFHGYAIGDEGTVMVGLMEGKWWDVWVGLGGKIRHHESQ